MSHALYFSLSSAVQRIAKESLASFRMLYAQAVFAEVHQALHALHIHSDLHRPV